MRRLVLCLAVAAGALVAAPAALADGGPMYVVQDGSGIANAAGTMHYVPVGIPKLGGGTLLEAIDPGGNVIWAVPFDRLWGLPEVGTVSPVAQGLSHDGRTLVLASAQGPNVSPSSFLVLRMPTARVRERITLRGYFSYDALSPDGSRLYLIQYVNGASGDLSHYLVRAYDLRTHRLLPEQIADRSQWQSSSTMDGTPITRVTSSSGRWVYTLYTNPSGKPFVHALDTVAATAHCISLPWSSRSQNGLYNVVLSLRHGGRTLALSWRSGRPWLDVATGSWRVSPAGGGSPWPWIGSGLGGGLALLAAGALLLRRRRGEELEQHARHELGLA